MVTDARGKSKIVGTLTDITERKLAEEKLKKYSEDLQKVIPQRQILFNYFSRFKKSL
ncbi:MAG: hypothetical protein IPI19_10990 [Ignavibacteriales bacterium]|nr:hypothetical protein [Ignavibacteriales bacterium]